MTVEAQGNKGRVATKNGWCGAYGLAKSIHDAKILSLMACRLSIAYSLHFTTLKIGVNRHCEIIIEIVLNITYSVCDHVSHLTFIYKDQLLYYI